MFCPFCIENIQFDNISEDEKEYTSHIKNCTYMVNIKHKCEILMKYTFGEKSTIPPHLNDYNVLFDRLIDEFYSENFHKGDTIPMDRYLFPDYWKCKWNEEVKISNKNVEKPKFYIASKKEIELIKQTIGNGKFVVTRVERCENKFLYTRYLKRRNKIIDDIGFDKLNESYLFHGSKSINYNLITTEGFDIGYAKYGSCGYGIYFSRSLDYSNSYVLEANMKSVLCCRLSIGKTMTGKNKCPTGYHSTINREDSDMVILYDDFQSYPEYIVYY